MGSRATPHVRLCAADRAVHCPMAVPSVKLALRWGPSLRLRVPSSSALVHVHHFMFSSKTWARKVRVSMKRRRTIYEGKAKILYEGPEPGTLVQYFKDDTTAFDAKKKAVIEGKGVLNNRISEY